VEANKVENNIKIPNSNESVSINLTVKEILSLSGDKFGQDHSLLIQARKKLRQQLENQFNH
jgi:hypothetical protein